MNNHDKSSPPLINLPPPQKLGFGARLRNYFLTGLVVAGPLFITGYITWTFINWVDDLVRPFIPLGYRPETYLPVKVPGTGLVVAFVSLTLLGFLTANLVGRSLVEIGEWILGRMPLVSSVYKGLKQLFETLFKSSGSTFRKVGLVEFPGQGNWSLVFFSAEPGPEISASLPNAAEEYVSVFLPCTPNPTTGFFFYLPKRDVIEIDISAESAAKLIMSAGVIQPERGATSQFSALAQATRAMRGAREKEMNLPANPPE